MDRCPRHIFNDFSEHLYSTKFVQLDPAESMAVYWKQVEAWKVYYRSTTRSMQGNEILVTSIGDNLLQKHSYEYGNISWKSCNTLWHNDLEMPSVSYSLGPSKCFTYIIKQTYWFMDYIFLCGLCHSSLAIHITDLFVGAVCGITCLITWQVSKLLEIMIVLVCN